MIRRFRDLASREPGSVLAGLFALAFAAFYLANSLAQVVVSILEQHFGSRDGPLEPTSVTRGSITRSRSGP